MEEIPKAHSLMKSYRQWLLRENQFSPEVRPYYRLSNTKWSSLNTCTYMYEHTHICNNSN